ncbi:hypothetical protein LC653_24345 [Nostoc sp. CHAB 5784]|uniref:hypothetical protein n=1 Tax=Nostoc mirabile TaxID=2907820 RepID=UPI001E2B4F1D|nr:hypothetical protein [Nostoc mirabile]MCC5666937.1 hypothetical protein [Nostoc mirabile CHAB5784]
MSEVKVIPGLELVGVEYGNGIWFGIYKYILASTTYKYTSNLNDFTATIQSSGNEGYELFDVGYGDGIWVGVFEKTISSTPVLGNIDPRVNYLSTSYSNGIYVGAGY